MTGVQTCALPIFNGKTIHYKVFEKEGLKIGLFSLGIEMQGLVDKKNYGNAKYLDPIEKSAEYAHLLKKDLKCDLVIALSHLGDKYQDKKVSDIVIAKQSKNIDLFIGGHTHRFYEKPLSIRNSNNEEVLIVQAGHAGIKLGKIDYFFNRSKKKKSADGSMLKISSN